MYNWQKKRRIYIYIYATPIYLPTNYYYYNANKSCKRGTLNEPLPPPNGVFYPFYSFYSGKILLSFSLIMISVT